MKMFMCAAARVKCKHESLGEDSTMHVLRILTALTSTRRNTIGLISAVRICGFGSVELGNYISNQLNLIGWWQ